MYDLCTRSLCFSGNQIPSDFRNSIWFWIESHSSHRGFIFNQVRNLSDSVILETNGCRRNRRVGIWILFWNPSGFTLFFGVSAFSGIFIFGQFVLNNCSITLLRKFLGVNGFLALVCIETCLFLFLFKNKHWSVLWVLFLPWWRQLNLATSRSDSVNGRCLCLVVVHLPALTVALVALDLFNASALSRV